MISHSPQIYSSANARKRIATSQIRAGMFLVRILDSWWRSPFFIHRRFLGSQDVQALVQSGIQEVEIDTSKGLDVSIESETPPMHETHGAGENTGQSSHHHSLSGTVEKKGVQDCRFEREQCHKVREDAIAALQRVFDGTKTGQVITLPALQTTAQTFIQKALAHPDILAETILVDHLEQFDKTLYAHVVDAAVLSILIGLQLGWDVVLLEEVAVAALLHDVGFMRLPQNLVHARWGRTGKENILLQQHVDMGLALLQKHAGCSREIVQMIGEHHAYQDGSGYPDGPARQMISASGKLLGLVDYFDELLAEGNAGGSFPAALVIRRIYQEAQKGKFPTVFVEAMIRVFGVYPVGTAVVLSTGHLAVVMKQNVGVSVKPYVKIIGSPDGRMVQEPEMKNLAVEVKPGEEVSIMKICDSVDHDLNLRKFFL